MGGCRSQVLIATGFNVPDRVEDPDGHPDNQLADADEVNVGESLDRPPDVLKGRSVLLRSQLSQRAEPVFKVIRPRDLAISDRLDIDRHDPKALARMRRTE